MDKDKNDSEVTSEQTESPAEIAYIRAKLIEAEKSGFTDKTINQIWVEARQAKT